MGWTKPKGCKGENNQMESITSKELLPKLSRHNFLQNANGKHVSNSQPFTIPPLTAAAPLASARYIRPPLQQPFVQFPQCGTASASPPSTRANVQSPLSTNPTRYQCQNEPFFQSTRHKPHLKQKKEKKKKSRRTFQRRIDRNKMLK